MHFDKRTYALKGDHLSLYTLEGRIGVEFRLGTFQEAKLEQATVKEAELVWNRRRKRFFFNLVLELPNPPASQGTAIMAVDLGENNLATTSFGTIHGGGKLRHNRDKYLALRSRLQRNGTQSSKQRLMKASGRERRHVRHVNHEVSKAIVAEARKEGVRVIGLEDLTHIRKRIKTGKRMRSRLHRWAFDELRECIAYKAEAAGIAVVYVNPAYTSLTCSKCGTLGVRKKHRFTCSTCGSQQHADYNASLNLCRLAASADAATCAVNRTHVASMGLALR